MAGIYIHVPFCKQACSYCDFHFSVAHHKLDDFVKALLVEIKLSKDYLQGELIETIYFGGGTPSILNTGQINMITDRIAALHDCSHVVEVTLEANPDDLSHDYLSALKNNTIVNRLSIGIQSIHDAELRLMNRAHTGSQGLDSIKLAQDIGLDHINADLIFGIPNSTDEHLSASIAAFLSLKIPHISTYALTIEQKTQLYHLWKKGKLSLATDETYARQMTLIMDTLKADGYEHYEISNYARTGYRALHNTNYWLGRSYLGMGPSAHSFHGLERRWNVANNTKYIDQLLLDNTIPSQSETLTVRDQYNEYLMTRLRTDYGVSGYYIACNFGNELAEIFTRQASEKIALGQMSLKENHYHITDDKKIISDSIISDLFV